MIKEIFLKQFQDYINKINSEIVEQLCSLGKEILKNDRISIIKSLRNKYEYSVLLLSDKDIEVNIQKEEVRGLYFPTAYDVQKSHYYSVDIAMFIIPIVGYNNIYFTEENLLDDYINTIIINNDSFVLRLCSFEKDLKNNDRRIEEIKSYAKNIIAQLNEVLNENNIKYKEFIDSLDIFIEGNYDIIYQEEAKKQLAISKLNPNNSIPEKT